MAIGVSLDIFSRALGGLGAAPPPPPASITVTDVVTDRALYDSGFAVGRNYGIIPVSGTGTDGETVEVRAVSIDDGGATSTAWVDVAVVSAGLWFGNINVPRSPSWYRIEARIKAYPQVKRTSVSRFGVGHRIDIWGQSEHARLTDTTFSLTPPVNISNPEAVQVFIGAAGSPSRHFVSNATPVTAAVSAMAATCIAVRPQDKFAIVYQAVPGTNFTWLMDDTEDQRKWSDAVLLHNLASSGGREAGLACSSWFAGPNALAASYADTFFPLLARKTTAGVAVTIPGDFTTAQGTIHADHHWGELYNFTNTRWVAFGPHRFDPLANLRNSKTLAAGGVYTNGKNREDCRVSWNGLVNNTQASGFILPNKGYSPLTYQNGVQQDATTWTDFTHPAGDTADGLSLSGRHTMLAVLQAAGLISVTGPHFHNCYWEPAGAYVEVWSSAGPTTTVRKARGIAEPVLPQGATWTHWTEVLGFEVNGIPAHSALIQPNGRVRILRPGGGNFVSSDLLTFGSGDASGCMRQHEDQFAKMWMNWPIVVQAGAVGVDGVPVTPLTPAAVLANTIVPSNPYFTTVAGQQTRFTDTAFLPTTGGAYTFALDVQLASTGNTVYLAETGGTLISCYVSNAGLVLLSLRDSSNATIFAATAIGTVTIGARFTLIIAFDLATNTLITTLNGVASTRTLPANTGVFASASRRLSFLSRSGGTTGNVVGTIYSLEVWNTFVAGGVKPSNDTNLLPNGRIAGAPATVNVHPWKAGGNVV